ncbi:MAG TPA: HEAT repeat domain-containing protein [Humisphaera sp.]|jgi:hypothetical protein|nr:HEAT repeat domain-containing protein [Humisphaera sp.]
MAQTPFQLALQNALESDNRFGGFREAFGPLDDDFKITDPQDAAALAAAIAAVAARDPDIGMLSPLFNLIRLLQKVGSEEAFQILQSQTMPVLEGVFDREFGSGKNNAQELGRLLSALANFGRREGFERVVRAIRSDLNCGWGWKGVFGPFGARHPFLHDLLAIPISDYPRGFVRVALLDHVNQLAIKGRLAKHPFDSDAGRQQIRDWIGDADPEHSSYAHSATAALPFISNPQRDELLKLAMNHVSSDIQLEAAWAAGKLGNKGGIEFLIGACANVATFMRAARYLSELGHEADIPAECEDVDFVAEAAARSWLAHPNEFGRQPDEIAPFDSRTILWPPADEERLLHLFHYRYRSTEAGKADTTGVVMTGGRSTFSLISETTADMCAEDIYALHCCWELEMNEDPRAPDERTVEAGRKILGWPQTPRT